MLVNNDLFPPLKTEQNEAVEMDFINVLPSEILNSIFILLEPHDLNSCSLACWKWNAICSIKLDEKFMEKFTFGKDKWVRYLGDPGVEPPLPKDIVQILKSPCPFWPGKKIYETHFLTLIPKTVDGNLLTFEELGEIVTRPKRGNQTKFRAVTNLSGELKEELFDGSSWVLMTKDVVPDTRDKTYDEQCHLIAGVSEKSKLNYLVPIIIAAAGCIFLEYISKGNKSFADNPWTYTITREADGKAQYFVGGFTSGLMVSTIVEKSHIVGASAMAQL